MKKIEKEPKMIVDITLAKSANDVYKAFVTTKYNNLTKFEKELLKGIIIDKYFDDLEAYCNEHDCERCDVDRETKEVTLVTKKPNLFKRLWNKLFKRSSK